MPRIPSALAMGTHALLLSSTAVLAQPAPEPEWSLEIGGFLGLTSRWSLPSTERGILSQLKAQERDLPFAGTRGDGISLELRPRAALDPRLTVAVFQNPLASAETALDPREELTQDVYGRVSFEPLRGLKVATSLALVGYQEQVGAIDSHAEFPMGSLEVELDTAPGCRCIRSADASPPGAVRRRERARSDRRREQ